VVDIDTIIKKATQNACETERLPDFNRRDAASLQTLRKNNYPMNRGMHDYFEELPALKSLISADVRLLDIGTGSGAALKEMVRSYRCTAVGTGICPIKDNGIDFAVAEASSLPFPDNSFDLVVSVHGISWAPNQIAAIKEATRVLRPNGYCLLNLIKFSSSVAIWYGEEFWDDLDVDVREFMAEFDFRETVTIPNVDIKVISIPMEDRMYKVKYYLECFKNG
jgi:SAM-dependent methyltransferase